MGWLHPYYEEMAHSEKRPLRRNLLSAEPINTAPTERPIPLLKPISPKASRYLSSTTAPQERNWNARATGLHPLGELSESVVHIRENSAPYGVDPEKIAVIGFSKGPILMGRAQRPLE